MNQTIYVLSNLLEHPGVFQFIETARRRIPGVHFLICGDLLNVFPEPGEDLEGSIFHEIFGGNLIVSGMDELIRTRFKKVPESEFLPPLREMFLPTGSKFDLARKIARSRYKKLFQGLSQALGDSVFSFIPGNMDYPDLALLESREYSNIRMQDQVVFQLGNFKFGALGGIPNSAHPFAGVVEISPYEMSEPEYRRRLWYFEGVDVLLTHLSPSEYLPLQEFLEKTPLQALICRAPFDFRREKDFRGKLEVQKFGSKWLALVRPFEFPENSGVVLDLNSKIKIEVNSLQVNH